jgi:esterase
MTTDATSPAAAAGGSDPDAPTFVYDEFSMLADNCREVAIELPADMLVERVSYGLATTAPVRSISSLRWGRGPVDLVLVHGAAQNAHTWDTVVLALHRHGFANILCIDLPGHGRSDWRPDHHYDPISMAADIAEVIAALAPEALAIVGMSLGGMTTLAMADRHPELVRRLVMIDVTPGVNALKAKAVTDFVRGPQSFDSFGSLLARTKEHNPTRTDSSLRRGILHNAHRNGDGTWSWNYDRGLSEVTAPPEAEAGEGDTSLIQRFSPMWDIYARLGMPLHLFRGSRSPIVDDNDVAEVLKRRPTAQIITIEDAGHSIQGDQPVDLANHLAALLR